MAKGTDMTDHINYLKTLAEHLEAVDDAVLEKDLVIILISSLSEEYNYLVTALETIAEEKLTWNCVLDRLIHEFNKMKNGNAGDKAEGDSSHDALISKQTFTPNYKPPDKKKIKCFNCKIKGHIAKNCFKKKADNNKQNETEEKSSKLSVSGHYVSSQNCYEELEVHPEIALTSSDAPKNNNSDSNWWIDSGASQHMSPVMKEMTDFVRFKSPLDVKLADNSVLHAYGKGTVHLSLFDGLEKINVTLKDVLYVPKIQNKLLSLPSVANTVKILKFSSKDSHVKL